MKRIFKSNLFFLTLVALQFLVPNILLSINTILPMSQVTILMLSTLFSIFVPTIIYFLITKKSVKNTLKFNKLTKQGVVSSLLLPFLCYPIASFCNIITSFFYTNNVGDIMQSLSAIPAFLFLIIFAVSPAIGEEIIMRGVVLDGYKKCSIHKAALINGLLFAILHFNMPQFLYAFFLGSLFSYLVYYTGSILSSMLVHFIFNAFSAVSFLIITKLTSLFPNEVNTLIEGNSAVISFGFSDLIYSFFIAMVCLIIILEIFKWLKKSTKEAVAKSNGDIIVTNCLDSAISDNSLDDEFKTFSPKLSASITYLPIVIAAILFILISI